jgi:membrane-associated phospholipid phosphatase
MLDRRDPVFTPARGSMAARIGVRMHAHRPFVVGLAVWAIALVVLAAALVGFGLLLVHVLLPAGVGRLDANIAHWFVAQRTPTLNDVTMVGSTLGSTGVVVGIAVLAGVVLAIRKHWRQVGFLVAAMTLEFIAFLTATLFVDRSRPDVVRLEDTPPTSSYPSGHTAASIALWFALAIIVVSLVRSAVARAVAWTLAFLVPILVGLSRMYRGMHHLSDVCVSVLLGTAAVLLALLVTRSAVAASEAERDTTVSLPRADDRLERAS